MHKPFLALAVTAAALATAGPALGADHSFTLSKTAKTAAWDSKAGPGALELQTCTGQTSTCDSTLIKVDDPGLLVVSTTADATLSDANLALYRSNAAGAPVEELGTGTGLSADEKVSKPVDPGYYLAVTTNETGYGAVHGAAQLVEGADEWATVAPAKRAALTADGPEFKWTGLAGNGLVFDCGEVAPAVQPCDEVLIHVTEPGDLSAAMSNASQTTVLDYMTIYTSDAAGSKSDDAVIAQGIDATNPNQAAAASVEPGYYLIQVGWLVAADGTYDGTATFTPAVEEEEPVDVE